MWWLHRLQVQMSNACCLPPVGISNDQLLLSAANHLVLCSNQNQWYLLNKRRLMLIFVCRQSHADSVSLTTGLMCLLSMWLSLFGNDMCVGYLFGEIQVTAQCFIKFVTCLLRIVVYCFLYVFIHNFMFYQIFFIVLWCFLLVFFIW